MVDFTFTMRGIIEKSIKTVGRTEKNMYLCIRKPQFSSATSLSIVVSLGQECTHVMPKSYRGLEEKSSRRVSLGVPKG